MKDTIITELRKIRDDHAEKFRHDVEAMAADLQRGERQSRGKLVRFKPRKVVKTS